MKRKFLVFVIVALMVLSLTSPVYAAKKQTGMSPKDFFVSLSLSYRKPIEDLDALANYYSSIERIKNAATTSRMIAESALYCADEVYTIQKYYEGQIDRIDEFTTNFTYEKDGTMLFEIYSSEFSKVGYYSPKRKTLYVDESFNNIVMKTRVYNRSNGIFVQFYMPVVNTEYRVMLGKNEYRSCLKRVASNYAMPMVTDKETKSWKAFSKDFVDDYILKNGEITFHNT